MTSDFEYRINNDKMYAARENLISTPTLQIPTISKSLMVKRE